MKKIIAVVLLAQFFTFIQGNTNAFAQGPADDMKSIAEIQENLDERELGKERGEDPLALSDEEMKKRMEDLESSEKDLKERMDEGPPETAAKLDYDLGVDLPVGRRSALGVVGAETE